MGLALSPHHCSRHRYFPRHKARLAVIGIQSALSTRSMSPKRRDHARGRAVSFRSTRNDEDE
jgi:hypothetical protein